MICPVCRSKNFVCNTLYNTTELVEIKEKGNKLEVEVHDIIEVVPSELLNEYKCIGCNKIFSIAIDDNGKEILVLNE